MSGLLKLIYSVDQEWPPRRKRQLESRVRVMLDCANAVWERDGIAACLEVGADHWQRISEDYPSDWVEVATEGGWL